MTLVDYINYIIIPILSLSGLLVFIRFLIGPSIPDRIVALDLLITIGIGFIACFCIVYNKSVFLDIAMILGLLAFLGTVAFSYYLEKIRKK
jgi:multicomponent Na+:H+ antiporter subunit F